MLVVQWSMKAARYGCANILAGLTHSLDYGKEGLAMHATRLKTRANHPVTGDKVLFDICVSCGTMFSNRRNVHGNYCSKTCRRTAKALEKQGIEVTPENTAAFLRQRKCTACKKPLEIGFPMNAKYCSEKCKRAVNRHTARHENKRTTKVALTTPMG